MVDSSVKRLTAKNFLKVILILNLNNMAWCLCDECDYRKECKYYRKVVVCPYMVKEENNNINTKEND